MIRAKREHLLSLQPIRVAATVPVLVHRADGVGHALGEADHARDLRAALASNGKDALAAAARSEHREAADAAQLRDERTATADVFPGVGELLGQPAPVAQPHRPLHFLIGAAKEIEDDRGVARAARVLQQQRVEKLRLIERRQPERFADAESDEAASGGVPAGMSFSQVQRVRQTLEDTRQSQCGRRNTPTRGWGAV